METVKSIIEDIISATFRVITDVYKYQKESKPKIFIVPPVKSFIIFPEKAKDDSENDGPDRISEQELRFIFIALVSGEKFSDKVLIIKHQ